VAAVLATLQSSFGDVIVVIVSIGIIGAVLSFLDRGKLYDEIGRGGLSLHESDAPPPESGGGLAAVRDEEIRQMLDARNARRQRRGEEPLDVDTEVARLTTPVVDQALRAEVRDHVIARNARRRRRGEEPLDVELEVERQLRELGTA
jgi:hypothetical protein